MSEVLDFAIEAALQAGKLLLGYFRNDKLVTMIKDDHSLVTQADLEADRFLRSKIHECFPKDNILSEELTSDFQISPNDEAKAVWIVDPLDGTTNFSLGLTIWGISIARLADGFPHTAVLYFPALNELYTAELGKGASFNNHHLQVDPEQYRMMSFFTCCSRTYRNYQVDIPYKTRILGSATYNFCCVARGIAALAFEATPKIWDIAACWLVVQEAGGFIQTLNGVLPFPLSPQIDYSHQNYPTIAGITSERLDWGIAHIHPK